MSSAVGDDRTFRHWINGVTDGPEVFVADKNAVLRVYTNLCKGVEELGIKNGYEDGLPIIRDLPPYPDPIRRTGNRVPAAVLNPIIVGPRVPRQTKVDRLVFNGPRRLFIICVLKSAK